MKAYETLLKKLRRAVENYKHAAILDSWKGKEYAADQVEIEEKFRDAKKKVNEVFAEISRLFEQLSQPVDQNSRFQG